MRQVGQLPRIPYYTSHQKHKKVTNSRDSLQPCYLFLITIIKMSICLLRRPIYKRRVSLRQLFLK